MDELGRVIDEGVNFFREGEAQFLAAEGESIEKINQMQSSVLAMVYLSMIRNSFIRDLENKTNMSVVAAVQFDLKEMIKLIKKFSQEIDEIEAQKVGQAWDSSEGVMVNGPKVYGKERKENQQ